MIYISLPEGKTRRLSFYLAMEEYVARHVEERDCFFMWQVEPTVIFGRNQLIENEVNLEFCKTHNIQTYRRKSGGGCVYADMNNIMFSYITDDESVNFTFNKYINLVVMVLRRMGIDARANGRNDVMVGDRKVSGNAFYRMPGRSIVHGTMLYDTDMDNMVGSITPSDEKLLSKGISSVRQRIALVKDYTDMTIEEFKTFVRKSLCDSEYMLTESDIKGIEEIEREYLSHEFIYGNNPKYTLIRKGHIDNVGNIELRMELKNNVIKSLTMLGDYFIVGEVDTRIVRPLKGVRLDRRHLTEVLPDRLDDVVLNLRRDDLIDIMLGYKE
ncbi:lipoate--protein ligase [Xylanibacter muris]|uniref:lipoate--protein ligase n=1 Tax=Xylanibacter muris TaxID=2736290 RepID=A0ABX2AN12_9BACT|nr:lipoate--protein ligase [Xylanibacter muris]NPD92618.1 lipoate--protein ligase [Xylanibacter muris]